MSKLVSTLLVFCPAVCQGQPIMQGSEAVCQGPPMMQGSEEIQYTLFTSYVNCHILYVPVRFTQCVLLAHIEKISDKS